MIRCMGWKRRSRSEAQRGFSRSTEEFVQRNSFSLNGYVDAKTSNVVVLHQNLGWLGLNRHYSIYALLPYAAFPSIMWLAKDDLLM